MFTLKNRFAYDQQNDLEDSANIKFALTSLGYHDDTEEGLSPYPTEKLIHSVKSFQKDNDLKVDGVINPDGPSHNKIKQKLKENNAETSLTIFQKRRQDMMEADTHGADKYFHCLANYEATSLGNGGWIDAYALSAAREAYGILIKKDPLDDVKEDLKANKHGRESARSGKYKTAQEACAIFRPKGLDEKY